MQREYETLKTMIHLYCREVHLNNESGLCFSCKELLPMQIRDWKNALIQKTSPHVINVLFIAISPPGASRFRK